MNELTIAGLEWIGALALFLGFILLVRYLDHRERMTMIERGILPDGAGRQRTRSTALLRGGLITAMVGFAVTLGLYTLGYLLPPPFSAVPGRLGPWLLPGLIPLAVGVALIASYYLAPPRSTGADSDADTSETDATQETDHRRATPRRGLRILGGSPATDTTRRDPDSGGAAM
ncbi:MAG TPA: DUF6249 domain-containing protein [Ktedonobacterales bacterium]|nr:DUF6249 domain-containing protein [Ktedonobacterales bacterium]